MAMWLGETVGFASRASAALLGRQTLQRWRLSHELYFSHHGRRLPAALETRAVGPSYVVVNETQSVLHNLSNGAEIFLVGTAHISKESAKEVREVIRAVKPDTIFVELCAGRFEKRRRRGGGKRSFLKEIKEMFSEPLDSISEVVIRGFYKYLAVAGFKPGLEFKVALQEASARRLRLVLGDQPADVTMQKLSDAVKWTDFLSIAMRRDLEVPKQLDDLYSHKSSLEQIVEGTKKRSAVRHLMEVLEKCNPKIVEVRTLLLSMLCRRKWVQIMVHERDAYMVEKLCQLEGKVVGVVGLAHLDGIERLWDSKQGSV